jgi:hypothetical protein
MREPMARITDDEEERPVLPWRLVVGALLHFILPAYVATLAIAGFVDGPRHSSAEALLDFALGASGKFLAFYILLIVVAAGTARLLDPPLRTRRARIDAANPALAAKRSQRRVARASAEAGRLAYGDATGRVTMAVTAIRDGRWQHGDDRFQALSADLAEATHTFSTAFETAGPDRRAEIAALAATSLERIAAALESLAAERGRLDEGDARTLARYIDTRYGPSDFTGDAS